MISALKSDAGNENQARMMRLLTALIRMREKSLMKPDEPLYSVVQVPLLMQNNHSLVH